MSSTITFTTNFNAQWIISVPAGSTPNWLTTNTNFWIGDATRPNGIQPAFSLDFGYVLQPYGVNLDLGNII